MALLADWDTDALLSHGVTDRLAADVSRFGTEATVMTVRWECEGGARPIPDKRGNGRA